MTSSPTVLPKLAVLREGQMARSKTYRPPESLWPCISARGSAESGMFAIISGRASASLWRATRSCSFSSGLKAAGRGDQNGLAGLHGNSSHGYRVPQFDVLAAGSH